MKHYLGLFFVASILSWLATPFVRCLASRLDAYGRAEAGRTLARVPRLGGIAIFVAAFGALLLTLATGQAVAGHLDLGWQGPCRILAPAMLMLLVGAYDDLRGATPAQKLAFQLPAAGMVWLIGFRIDKLPLFGTPIENPLLSLLLTTLWVVTVTNAINLIDGLDGLAAGVAFFATLSLFAVSVVAANYFVCAVAAALAGALVGFLKFNLAPAKVYLGDTGSLFLGFILASLAIHASRQNSTPLATVVPYVALGLPLLDTSLAVARRLLTGQSIFQGDCNHIHHRLVKNGLSPNSAVLFLYLLAALFSLGSLTIMHLTASLLVLMIILCGASLLFVTRQLRYEEFSQLLAHLSKPFQPLRRILLDHSGASFWRILYETPKTPTLQENPDAVGARRQAFTGPNFRTQTPQPSTVNISMPGKGFGEVMSPRPRHPSSISTLSGRRT